MNELITKQYRHLLWHDEIGEPFLLLKYAEVFEYSQDLLGLHCWSKKMLAVLRFEGLISFEMATDDPLHILRVDKCHLSRLIELGAFKKRPDINGKWIKEKKKLLAHKILVYRSTIKKDDAEYEKDGSETEPSDAVEKSTQENENGLIAITV